MIIAISTCKKYQEKTLPICVGSLCRSGIEKSDILIVSGGHEVEDEVGWDDCRLWRTHHNSFDYTALIEVVLRELNQGVFLLHDTFRVGPDFKNKLHAFPLEDRRALKRFPSMSVGYYSDAFLKNNRKVLTNLRNFDNSENGLKLAKKAAIDNEDLLLHKLYGPAPLFGDYDFIRQEVDGQWFETEVARCQEYFPQLDLYKLKANGAPNQREEYITRL